MYSSLHDVWPNMNSISLNHIPSNYKFNNIVEPFNQNYNYELPPHSNIINQNNLKIDNNLLCDKFINHIENCSYCNNKFRNKYLNSYNLNSESKEIIIVFLIGFIIILILNLFIK